jgi:hypothetical protein
MTFDLKFRLTEGEGPMRVSAIFALSSLLVFASTAPTFAQNQLPLNFRGLTSLELGPNELGGAQDDLVARRSHRGHQAADVRPGLSAPAPHTVSNVATLPRVRPQRVVAADSGFFGFAGLNHFDQRFAGTGAYTNTQFSEEPPDQGLCVGSGYVMEIINSALAVYDLEGNLLSGPTANNQFFQVQPAIIRSNPPVFGQFIYDPRCYFDPATRRWFITESEFATDPNTGAFKSPTAILIAVSQGSNPIGGYFLYSIDTTDGDGSLPGHPGCPCAGDQPLIGADANGFYISTNEFPIIGNGFNGAQLYAVSKAALVGGNLSTVVHINIGAIAVPAQDQANGGIWYSVQPATSPAGGDEGGEEGSGTEYFLSALQFGPAPFDNRIAVWALTNTASLPSNSPNVQLLHIVINTESYGMAPGTFSAPQKRGPTPLRDALGDVDRIEQLAGNDDRMNQVVFAAGNLWAGVNTSIAGDDSTRLGIAWFEVRPSLQHGQLDAAVQNQGYLSVSGQNVIFPSIGVNQSGQAVMAFTLVGRRFYPTAAYSTVTNEAGDVRIAGAGVGPEDGFTGYSAYGGSGVARWGDYSAAAADGHGNIWFGAEYIGQTCSFAQFAADTTCGGTRSLLANWGTFIGKVSTQ